MITRNFVICKSPSGNELVDPKELSEPTRRLTTEELAEILKNAKEITRRPTVKAVYSFVSSLYSTLHCTYGPTYA